MDACGQVMEEVVSRAIGRQERREELERAAGALSYLHLVLGDSRVLGTVGHIWLCKKSRCFVSWTKSENAWAALRLSLQRWEDSAMCSRALLSGNMQECWPDRDRTGDHQLLS